MQSYNNNNPNYIYNPRYNNKSSYIINPRYNKNPSYNKVE